MGGTEEKKEEPAKKPIKPRQSSRQKPPAASKRCPAGKAKGKPVEKERKAPETVKDVPRKTAPSLKLVPVCPILTAEPRPVKHSELGSEEKPRLRPRALSRSVDSSIAQRRQLCHSCTTRSMLLSPCGLPTLRSPASNGGSRGLQVGPLDATATAPAPHDPPPPDISPELPPACPEICTEDSPMLRQDPKRKSL